MKKCPICLGCMEEELIGNHYIYYCSLCKKYYKITSNGLVEIDEEDIDER
jgi:hypothetical protein